MKKSTKKIEKIVTMSKKDFDLLTSLFPKLVALEQHLENVVHPK